MDFEKKVINTFATNLVSSGFRLVGTIILGRLIGPEGLGVFTMLCAFPLVVVALASIGLPSAAVYFLARYPARRPQIVNNLFLYAVVAGGAVAVGIWAIVPLLEEYYFKQSIDVSYFVVICLGIPLVLFARFGMSILQGLYRINERNFIQVLIRAIPVPAFLLFVWAADLGITGALLGWAMAYVIVCICVLIYIRRDVMFSWTPKYEVMPDVFRYGYTAYLGQLIDQVQGHVIILILAAMVDSAELGVFSIAMIFSQFVLWPSTAIRRPMLPRLSRMDSARTADAFIQLTQVGLLLSLLFAIAIMIVSPYAIPLLYGISFEGVARLIFILIPGMICRSAVIMINGYFMSIGKPNRRVYINIFRAISLIIAIILGGLLGGIWYATLSMSIAFLLTMIVAVSFACWRNPHVHFRDICIVRSSLLTYLRKLKKKVLINA